MIPDRPTTLPTWPPLLAHGRELRRLHLRELGARDPERFVRLSLQACGLLLDFSKQKVTGRSIELLLAHAYALGLPARIEALFGGELVNTSERRAALHGALRYRGDAPCPSRAWNVMPEVREVLGRMRAFCDALGEGTLRGYSGRPLRNVVNIGIGGSDLGPAMASEALETRWRPGMGAHFVSSLDSTDLARALARSDPEETLFIVVSKTFGTRETLVNAASAREWLVRAAGEERAVAHHFAAVSARPERACAFGVAPRHVFEIWDWVGGRYSLWSAAGLSVAALAGMDDFEALLAGAGDMDEHFRGAPLAANAPVLLALVGVWNRNVLGAATHAVLPYDYALARLPAYLQQLEMESNGKRVDHAGRLLDLASCPVVWGGPGSDAQHAFFQKLHQGGELVPCDFLVAARGQRELGDHQREVIANALAQSRAMMVGRHAEEFDGGTGGPEDPEGVVHRVVPGDQPSTTIVYERLTPRVLGALIALYEHKVFVQGVCWGVNSFDQWGVELGKQLAGEILARMEEGSRPEAGDPSTEGLLRHLLALRGRAKEA